MYDDINEIFGEFEEKGDIHGDCDIDSRVWARCDSVTQRIRSFQEVFTEYYLFDSSIEKDIKTFLKTEVIDDVFSETDIMDLICGNAYLDDDLVRLISIKLPFRITLERLRILNACVKKQNPGARRIEKSGIIYRINALTSEKAQQVSAETNRKARERYHKNRPAQLARKKRYRETHPDQGHQYYIRNKKHILARDHEYYLAHRCEKLVKRKKRYEENKEEILASQKQYYQKNKERISARGHEYYEKKRERAKAARNVCAVYLFLLRLKKENREQYLNFYSKSQDPVTSLMKTCVALQNMDISMCPLANCAEFDSDVCEKCSAPNIFSIPGAVEKVKEIVQNLRTK